MRSPFEGLDTSEWQDKRDELIEEHPLDLTQIKEVTINSFNELLQTRIGDPKNGIKIFEDIEISNQVQGDFLEAIVGKNFKKIDNNWRNGTEAEKDFIYSNRTKYSTELKTSGQEGVTKVFGNRSYAQKVEKENAKKSKTGYYITVNFYKDLLYLIRFGWIDFQDWTGQSAESGQAATLPNEVYEHKLRDIKGEYRLNAPILILDGIGPSTKEKIVEEMGKNDMITVSEFIESYDANKDYNRRIEKGYKNALDYKSEVTHQE